MRFRFPVLFAAAVWMAAGAALSACAGSRDMESSASSTKSPEGAATDSTDSANNTNSSSSTSERDYQGYGYSSGSYRGSDIGRLGGGIGRLGGGWGGGAPGSLGRGGY